MNLLRRILGQSSQPCDSCGQATAARTLRLPTGKVAKLCSRCATHISTILADPIPPDQFWNILEALAVADATVCGVPWCTSRDIFLQVAPPDLAHSIAMAENRSPNLYGTEHQVAGRLVKLWFAFDDGQLARLVFEPQNPVPEAQGVLSRWFGTQILEQVVPGINGPERQVTWRRGNLEVTLEQSAFLMADVSIRHLGAL